MELSDDETILVMKDDDEAEVEATGQHVQIDIGTDLKQIQTVVDLYVIHV